ncbi:hypothetical protein [Rhizobium leguminosarum]|nr:hypothetical protein [Rhizobium leguminosarum]
MLYFFDLDPDSGFRPARPKIIRIWAIESVVSEYPTEFAGDGPGETPPAL